MKNTKKKNSLVSSEHWIVKSNVLNEVRNTRMTISQIRLFSVYLSKINPLDEKSREVTLKLDEYTKIMQFKQTNTTRLMKAADELLELKVTYFDKDGQYNNDGLVGFVKCQIFKRFRLYKNADNEWLVTIDCHDDVVKLMIAPALCPGIPASLLNLFPLSPHIRIALIFHTSFVGSCL